MSDQNDKLVCTEEHSPKIKEKAHSLMLKIMIFAYFITTGIIILLSTINMAFILKGSTNHTFYNFVLRIRELPLLLATTIFITLFVTKKKGNDILFWITLGLYAASLSCTIIANNYAHIVGLIRNVNPLSGVLPAKTQLIFSYFDVAFTVATYALLPLAFAHKNENAVGVWAKLKNSVLYYVVLALLIISVVVLYTTTAVSVIFVMQTLLFAIPVALTYLLFRLTKDNETTFFSKNPDDKNAPVLSQRILIQILLSCILLMLLTGNIVHPLPILADSYTATFAFITFTLIPIACVVCYFVFTSGNAKLRIALCAVYAIAGIYLGTLLVNPIIYYSPYFSNNPWIYVSFYVVLGAISVAQLFTMHDKQALPQKQLFIAKICLTAAEVLFVALAVTLTFVHNTYDQQIIPIFTYLQLIFFILNCVIKQPRIKSTPVVDVAVSANAPVVAGADVAVSVNAPVVVGTDVAVAVAVNATTNVDVSVDTTKEQPSFTHTGALPVLLRTFIYIYGAISIILFALATWGPLLPTYNVNAASIVKNAPTALIFINAIIFVLLLTTKKANNIKLFLIPIILAIVTPMFLVVSSGRTIGTFFAQLNPTVTSIITPAYSITILLDLAVLFTLPLALTPNDDKPRTLTNLLLNHLVYYAILIVAIGALVVPYLTGTFFKTLATYLHPVIFVAYLLLFERTQDRRSAPKENDGKKPLLHTAVVITILLVTFFVTLIYSRIAQYNSYKNSYFTPTLIFACILPLLSFVLFFIFTGGNRGLKITLGAIFIGLLGTLTSNHFASMLKGGLSMDICGVCIYCLGIVTVLVTTTLPDRKNVSEPIKLVAKTLLILFEALFIFQITFYYGRNTSLYVFVITWWHLIYFALLSLIKKPWTKKEKKE